MLFCHNLTNLVFNLNPTIMRKTVYCLLIILLSVTFVPTLHAHNVEPIRSENATSASEARAKVLTARLEEIKEMDRSSMSRVEKRELRKEVKAIKSELRSTGNGVYLSVGAIIIIILLLILLL